MTIKTNKKIEPVAKVKPVTKAEPTTKAEPVVKIEPVAKPDAVEKAELVVFEAVAKPDEIRSAGTIGGAVQTLDIPRILEIVDKEFARFEQFFPTIQDVRVYQRKRREYLANIDAKLKERE